MRESHRNVRRIYAVLKGYNIEWFSQLHSNIFGSILVKFGFSMIILAHTWIILMIVLEKSLS